MTNEVLIRLKDIDNINSLINSFYTENPCEYLKMYKFCEKEEIAIHAKDKNDKEIIGIIDTIEVGFGGGNNIPYIDVWINKWG